MGKRSRKRARTGAPPHGQRPSGAKPGPGRGTVDGGEGRLHRIEQTFLEAMAETDRGRLFGPAFDRAVDQLGGWWSDEVGREEGMRPTAVPSLLSHHLTAEVASAWERGWQPADLHRVVGRRLATPYCHLLVRAVAEQAETYRGQRPSVRRWLDQLEEIGARVEWEPGTDHLAQLGGTLGLSHRELVRHALVLRAHLRVLPPVARLCPPPSDWGRSAAVGANDRGRPDGGVDVRYLERIRALLAKAESTEFDEEAAAFTAKAHELMTRHAIDAALLEAHAAGRKVDAEPAGVRIGIDDPYALPKNDLLSVIGHATRCRTVWSKNFGYSTVFGFPGDLEAVELLFTSLLVQASSAMARAGALGPHARTRGFRHSFLLGFADRIGTRLDEASRVTVAGIEAEIGGLVPVLADRAERVDRLLEESFDSVTAVRSSVRDAVGWRVGVLAADEARLFYGSPVEERATA